MKWSHLVPAARHPPTETYATLFSVPSFRIFLLPCLLWQPLASYDCIGWFSFIKRRRRTLLGTRHWVCLYSDECDDNMRVGGRTIKNWFAAIVWSGIDGAKRTLAICFFWKTWWTTTSFVTLNGRPIKTLTESLRIALSQNSQILLI